MVVIKNYPGTRSDLYTIIGIGLENVKFRISDFTNFRGIYVDSYIDSMQGEADACELLPDEDARKQPHESLRLEVVELAGICLKRWRYLKRYCAAAFPNDKENQWYAGGWEYYAEAANDGWPSVKSLMVSAKNYIASNAVALAANQNMPAGFALQVTDSYSAFLLKLNEFYQAEEAAQVSTQSKLEAENSIFHKVMECLLDGAVIFEDDEAVRKQYEWAHISSMVSPDHGTPAPPVETEAVTTYTIEGEQVQGGSPLAEAAVVEQSPT